MKTSTTQERTRRARETRILQARKERGGGVAPRRSNRITESATKKSREEAKRKAKKAIQKKQTETPRRKDKTKEGARNGNTENDKRKRKQTLRSTYLYEYTYILYLVWLSGINYD